MQRIAAGVLVALLLALPAAAARAQTDADAFVKTLVDAINSKQSAQRRALLHTDSLRCTTPGKDLLLDEQFARQARFPIPGTVAWRLTAAPPGRPMFGDRFDYPVRPTHLMQLDVKGENNETMYVVLQLARQQGLWREVVGCPKPETAAAATRVALARAEGQEKVNLLLKTMAPQLRADVLALLKSGRKADAIGAYRDVSGADLATATSVVEALAKEPGG
jgi:ribosomal protein L7/L12